jgi:predicted phage tail protein
MLTKVILEGEFAKVAGRKIWMLDCNSAAEAIQLISANCQGKIRTWIRQNLDKYKICEVECESEKGVKEKLVTETFLTQRKCKTIRFLPIFTGAGGDNGILQAVIGVVLVVVGVLLSPYTGGSSMVLAKAGVGLIIGAICTMLMTPSQNDDEGDSASSYYFNGAVNTTTQGAPVPLVFGRCRVGSAVVSASIDVTEA